MQLLLISLIALLLNTGVAARPNQNAPIKDSLTASNSTIAKPNHSNQKALKPDGTIIDVYGIDYRDAEKIKTKYGYKVANIELSLQKEFTISQTNAYHSSLVEKLFSKRSALIDEIKKSGKFLFADFQTVYYFSDKTLYTTIEIIDKNHPQRLNFVNLTPIKKPATTKAMHHNDLIDEWIKYDKIGIMMLVRNQVNARSIKCPVYHCVAGFEHPILKPYLEIFNQGAIKNQDLIISTLRHDPNPERRAAAAFLIAHFHDPKHIIAILSPSIYDIDHNVRNNAMRALEATFTKAKLNQIDITPFLNALASPYNTDRNKALYILLKLSKSESTKKIIITQAGTTVLALMQLKQPNNRLPAYLLLKQISNQDFGINNIYAWEKWLQASPGASPGSP